MKKLERSLRSQLNYYGPDLRHGYYKPIGWTGVITSRKGFKMLRWCSLFYDLKAGKVKDVLIVCYGEAYELRYIYDSNIKEIDVTPYVVEYLQDGEETWDMLVHMMLEEIEDFVENYKEMHKS